VVFKDIVRLTAKLHLVCGPSIWANDVIATTDENSQVAADGKKPNTADTYFYLGSIWVPDC
jgi:hypothetical protein